MKILYISPTFEGGIGGHAKRVADKLKQNGFDIELMQIPKIPIKNLKNPSFTIFGMLKTKLNKTEYDIVHAWNIPSGIIMKNIIARKKILSIHGMYGQQIKALHSKTVSKIGELAEIKAIKNADILTTDSKFVQKSYKNSLGIEVEYLPAPLDIEKFHIIDNCQKNNQVIYIGRNSPEKGIDILKNIESNINANVVYCTNLDWNETMKILQQSKILVVPSRQESIPQVIKEAFYLKIPVIATKVGGIPELIENEKTGILVSSENPKELSSAINNLLQNTELQKKIVNNAHSYILENFTWEKLLPKYIQFYKNLIN